ncbi:MAG: radical SAM protein, partial [Crocosphaera sp.]
MKSSRYNIFVPLHNGRMLAYNGFSGALAVWEKQEQETYQILEYSPSADLDRLTVRNLIYGGYVVNDDVDELTLLQQQYHAHRFNPQVMTLTIAPTLDCNFGCDYCFQGQDKPVEVMSMEVQDAIIALVERAAPGIKQLGIAWYGGEPLLRPKIIEALSDRLIEVCQRHGIAYSAMMVSNGYRLTVEVAKSLYQRGVKTLQVTLDGTPEYHDQRRVLLSGQETFKKIVDNLKAVVDAVPLTLSIRVNIDHRNREQIKKLLDLLATEGLGQRKNFKVYFAPVEAMTEGCHLVEDVTMGKSDYGQLEAELYRYGFEKGLTQLPYPPRFHGSCAAVKPKGLVIIPSGSLHKCWDTVNNPLYAVGNIFDLDAVQKSELMQQWLNWTPFA